MNCARAGSEIKYNYNLQIQSEKDDYQLLYGLILIPSVRIKDQSRNQQQRCRKPQKQEKEQSFDWIFFKSTDNLNEETLLILVPPPFVVGKKVQIGNWSRTYQHHALDCDVSGCLAYNQASLTLVAVSGAGS